MEEEVNAWVLDQGLPEGDYLYELVDEETGNPLAIFDLAWPQGLQEELSEPVALLIDEGREVLTIADERVFKCFTNVGAFKRYVRRQILEQKVSSKRCHDKKVSGLFFS